jgi:lipoic acid synthetase
MALEKGAYPRHPEWLKVRIGGGANFFELKQLVRQSGLHTVCEEARCPNIAECWEMRTATFMILGAVCTRHCGFCAVTAGRPGEIDWAEPARVAAAIKRLGLKHAVITAVARDDLEDGGAAIFAATIRNVRLNCPDTTVEVLISDLGGSLEALRTVVAAKPAVLNHNVETVERLTPRVRSRATYRRSLEVLARAKELDPDLTTKSGLMLGLGEEREEVVQTLEDLRAVGVDVVTIGQYLRPSPRHLPLVRYVAPEEFSELKEIGLALGFRHVESGPLVRSSYHAARHAPLPRQAGT